MFAVALVPDALKELRSMSEPSPVIDNVLVPLK
jgi:hypothetical protein